MAKAKKLSGAAGEGTRRGARGFTLMELMVAIAIMVVIILSVGVTFSGASKSVGISQATMELMSNVRATQQLIDRDVSGIDKNGFLVIRARLLDTTPANAERSLRFDQVSFLSNHSFPHLTGADTASPFTESSEANTAFVWWGHLILETSTRPNSPAGTPDMSYMSPPSQGTSMAQNLWPTGVFNPGAFPVLSGVKESECTLGRSAILLLPGALSGASTLTLAGQPVNAYATPERTPNANFGPGMIKASTEANPAFIYSSRFDVAAMSPSQVIQRVLALKPLALSTPEADFFCYRFRALATVYDTEEPNNPFVNGYFRMHPVVMQSVSSFKVEWTDGAPYDNTDAQGRVGQLKWYGPTNPKYAAGTTPAEQFYASGDSVGGDHYIATFNSANRAQWPKALRFTMHVASDRLVGGRDFVQVIKLPE